MAANTVQTVTNNGGGYVTSMQVTFGSDVTSGNLIVIAIGTGTYNVNTVTDGLGNTYTLIEKGNTANMRGELWYAYNITGGSCTITVDIEGDANFDDIITTAREYSGIDTADPLDQSTENTETQYGTSHSTGTTPPNSQNQELAVAMYVGDDNETYTVGNGFSNLVDTDGDDVFSSLAFADKDLNQVAGESAIFTSTDFLRGYGAIATFRETVTAHYSLGSVNLPRPSYMRREPIEVKQDMLALDGKSNRDIGTYKERFVLGWEIIAAGKITEILNQIDLQTALAFNVNDGDFVINQTSVFALITSRILSKGGSGYESIELELTEVS